MKWNEKEKEIREKEIQIMKWNELWEESCDVVVGFNDW